MILKTWINSMIGSAVLGGILLASTSAYAAPASPPNVFVNGQYESNAISVEGRTLVKLRAL